MPEPTPNTIKAFASSDELNLWLQENHDQATELWVKIYKKASGVQSVNWDDVVIESLCWGWIDGIKKSLDNDAYLQRITPRKPRSDWSKRNTEHVERLIEQGRMQDAGMKHVTAAKKDGRWEKAYTVSQMEIPQDFMQALETNAEAKAFFATLTKSNRTFIAHSLTSAKRAETRHKRFDKLFSMLVQQQRPN